MPFATTWIDLEDIILSEWHKSDRERQILHDFTYMRNLKTKTKQKQTQRYREQADGCQRVGVGGMGIKNNSERGRSLHNFSRGSRIILPLYCLKNFGHVLAGFKHIKLVFFPSVFNPIHVPNTSGLCDLRQVSSPHWTLVYLFAVKWEFGLEKYLGHSVRASCFATCSSQTRIACDTVASSS